MKILVPTKRVPDTDQKIRLRDDQSGIDLQQLPFVINPFDAIALEEAIRISEQQESVEILAVGIGSELYETELRTALAMGADRALLVKVEQSSDARGGLDSWNVACILKEIVHREQPQIVLMGKQAVDDDASQAGQFLAAMLNWPQATFASKIDVEPDELRVARETDAGIETIRVRLPAVITTDLRLNEPRYASLPSILKSRKKQIERIDVAELGIVVEPRIEILEMEVVSSSRNCQIVGNLDELVKVIQQATGSGPEATGP
jgi:electron transfer flavoprotein beta subunit